MTLPLALLASCGSEVSGVEEEETSGDGDGDGDGDPGDGDGDGDGDPGDGDPGDGDGDPGDGDGDPEPPHETDWSLCTIDLTCAQPLVDDPKRSCDLLVMEGDGYVAYEGAAGVEVRGRSSQGWPKHQYDVELWSAPNHELVAPGASWKYNDSGNAGGNDWMQPEFDDGQWSEGLAPLGYGVLGPQWQGGWAASGQIDNATTIGFGPNAGNKHTTTWFRHSFEVANVAVLDPVYLQLRADDGAVVYLNGVEIARFNLSDGQISSNSLAQSALSGLDEVEFRKFPVDNQLLVNGTNVVAVEVHQGNPASSDLVLDLALSTKPPANPTNFYEFGQEEDWVLNGMYFDLSLYRNKLMYDTFAAFDPEANYASESHYCELTLNGDWVGIYTLGEKIKRDDDRIDIPADDGLGGSFIFKSDVTQTWVTTHDIGWQLVYPKLEDLSPESEAAIMDYMNDFSAATYGNGSVWDYVDMASLVDFVLIQEFTRNGDGYSSSMHIYKAPGGKITFVPWDFDIGLGGSCNNPETWNGRENNHWLNIVAADPVFQEALVARWAELRETVLSQDAIDARLADLVDTMTAEKIGENFARWPMAEIIGGDDWVLLFRLDCPVNTWDEEHMTVQSWIAQRLAWMDANIETFN
ncbi:CotH kinase family protein [Enhygromyxa salina]|uniref:CotH kinase family protein n=1 Tax=Enhygromyxa salina TaxID=215803 RepID=UPI0015E5CAD1|nr:CotH kinase family protein [Enhygromyxa salina]